MLPASASCLQYSGVVARAVLPCIGLAVVLSLALTAAALAMERGRRGSESTAGSAVSRAVAKLDRVLFPRSWPAAQRIKHRRPSKFWRRIITASPETRGEILHPRQLWRSSCFAFCHICLAFYSSFSSLFAICGTQRHKPLMR